MTLKLINILDVNDELIELVRNWRNRKDINKFMFTNHYINKDEHRKWIENLKNSNIRKAWVIKYSEKPIGFVQLTNIDNIKKTTEWGFYIADKLYRSKGIGSLTLYKLIEYVFNNMKFDKMKTKVLENNTVALKLYKKFGFRIEGKPKEKIERDNKKIDVYLMSLKKDEWKKVKLKLNL